MPRPLAEISIQQAKKIKWLLSDVDDTLTWEGALPHETYVALAKLKEAGVKVVAVTGACAGWCDQIAKLWPVHGVIGENGAFWMQKTVNGFVTHETKVLGDMKRQQAELVKQLNNLLIDYPDVGFAFDQPFRYCDVAINLSQDREPISDQVCEALLTKIKKLTIEGHCVNAVLSSIHLNVWVGDHSKRSSAQQYLLSENSVDENRLNEICYIGDSLNDESMFEWLPMTFGVKNIEKSLSKFKTEPTFITTQKGGYGFVELAEVILNAKKSNISLKKAVNGN